MKNTIVYSIINKKATKPGRIRRETGDVVAYTFRGGIHIEENKNTSSSPTEEFLNPVRVAIAMQQHIGAPCVPLVKAGDRVKIGQCVGDRRDALCCPVHASVAGTVTAVEDRRVGSGAKVAHVVIENDFSDEMYEGLKPADKALEEMSGEEIIERVREAGIAGMGGAAFPTYAKMQSAVGKAKHLIINCAECEPYITSNHRLLLERPAVVVNGVKILIKALGVRRAVIAVEDNKMDAVRALKKQINDPALIDIKILKTKYPQGDERQIIYALYGKEIPTGKLPADVGCVLFNPETVACVYYAMSRGMPVIRKRVTVDGDAIKKPKNLLVPVGTSFREIAQYCGGTKKRFEKLVSGGPMMGAAQWDMDACVVKGTGALLFFTKSVQEQGQCVRCGKCLRACQMRLMPALLAAYSEKGDFAECEKYGAMSCVECGCCTYICPGRVPIVQYIRNAKGAIIESRKRLSAQ